MPNTCSVPNCRSNYKGEPYTHLFSLPKSPDLADRWIRAICRDGASDLKSIYVCIKHFREEDILRRYEIRQGDGSIQHVDRSKPKLSENAIPCILPSCPKYLSSFTPKPIRLTYEAKEQELFDEALKLSISEQITENERYNLCNFENLKEKLISVTIPDNWIKWYSDDYTIHFIKPSLSGQKLSIESSLSVNRSLAAKAFVDGKEIRISVDVVKDIREIETIIQEIDKKQTVLEVSPNTTYQHISKATKHIKETIHQLEQSSEVIQGLDSDSLSTVSSDTRSHINRLQFILCQLENAIVPKNRRRYNIITQVVALKSHLISPICYNYLQSLECLSLPHHRNLQKLYTNFGIEDDYIVYLKQATTHFTQQQRNVIIQMDEIHVKSDLTYKAGRIFGSSGDLNEPTRTVLALMVSSLHKRWSTIIRLIPCSKTSAEFLLPTVKKAICDIELCGLKVQVLCTDNYPLNVSIFKLFSPDKSLNPSVPHPCDSNRTLFLIFDFVHILKSIRNNWINLKDFNKSFQYPQFDDFTSTNIASFEDVRLLYRSDQHNVIKLAPRLTAKSCWPSMLERQNVSLALRVFDDSTAAALALQNSSRQFYNYQTSDFIKIIIRVWKIFNVNTPVKGIHLKDDYSLPLRHNDARFCFLSHLVSWLDQWQNIPDSGKLSKQTFTSFKHSTISLTKIVNHLTENCGFDYVLTSFLQNDPLEHHFGLYRMMAGAHYHITYCQILETEHRLKLSSILKLFVKTPSDKQTSLNDFLKSFATNIEEQITSDSNFYLTDYSNELKDFSSIDLDTRTLQSLAFVAGYAVHSYFKKSHCETCLMVLSEPKPLEIEEPTETKYVLISLLDRGSLKWPSDCVLEAIISLWKIFLKIQQNDHLMQQLIIGPSRKILIQLAINLIDENQSESWRERCIGCNALGWDVLRKLLSSTANCILSNKVKNVNAQLASRGEGKRKLKKFKED